MKARYSLYLRVHILEGSPSHGRKWFSFHVCSAIHCAHEKVSKNDKCKLSAPLLGTLW